MAFLAPPGGGGREWLNEADIAAVCPEVSHFAVHLPLRMLSPGQPAGTNAVRVLRLCRELCRVLPSKERAPYLVVAEVLQTSFRSGGKGSVWRADCGFVEAQVWFLRPVHVWLSFLCACLSCSWGYFSVR